MKFLTSSFFVLFIITVIIDDGKSKFCNYKSTIDLKKLFVQSFYSIQRDFWTVNEIKLHKNDFKKFRHKHLV